MRICARTLTLIIMLCFMFVATPSHASPDRNFEGFSGSIKSHKVNVRAGPGTNFPILWVFKMQGYPVRTIAKYSHWYQIQDAEGEQGWVHKSFVSRIETALVHHPKPVTLYRDRDGKQPLLKLESGVLVLLNRCALGLCEVEVSGKKGWIDEAYIKRP